MLYLNNSHISSIGADWNALINRIREAVGVLQELDFSQPVKPYLRYKDPKNRIIAMPAYVGGTIQSAGIKWIASFPDNINYNIPRAHAVIILNDVLTGKPLCTFNATYISIIRTAAVTGLVMDEYFKSRTDLKGIKLGINGFGPIGRAHLEMIDAMFGNRISEYFLYDLLPERISDIPENILSKVKLSDSWESMYGASDIFITCTVSSKRYIDVPPAKGSLQLNISLRDYIPAYRKYIDLMIVDDWTEVCRENTDIELMHKQEGLEEADTVNLRQLIYNNTFKTLDRDAVAMFNPMGMGVFDIAIASYYHQLALDNKKGIVLND